MVGSVGPSSLNLNSTGRGFFPRLRSVTKTLAVLILAALPRAAAACEVFLIHQINNWYHPSFGRVVAPTISSKGTCGGSGVCMSANMQISNAPPGSVLVCTDPNDSSTCDFRTTQGPFITVLGNGACTPMPGDFTCLFNGSGLLDAQVTVRVQYTGHLAQQCEGTLGIPFFVDSGPPGVAFDPDPSGKILSSTESLNVVATDEAMLANFTLSAGELVNPPVFYFNTAAYPPYDPAKQKVRGVVPLTAQRGAVTVRAQVWDTPLNTAGAEASFRVDAEVPRIVISTPPLVSPAGVVLPVSGTASDDLGLAAVEV